MDTARTDHARLREAVIGACQALLAALEEESGIRDQGSGIRGQAPDSCLLTPDAEGSEIGGAGARAARGSERLPQPTSSDRIGTGFAFDRLDSTDRSIESKERVSKTLSFDDRTIESIGAVQENDVRCDAVKFLAERITRELRPKPGRRWRDDRRLIATAAVLAIRLDAISADSQTGQRWIQAALDAVGQFQPKNVFGYFTRCLQNGLREIDPTIRDQTAAAMIWMRLTRRVPIPEVWLAEPPQKPLESEPRGRAMPDVDPQELAAWQAHLDTELALRRGLRKAE